MVIISFAENSFFGTGASARSGGKYVMTAQSIGMLPVFALETSGLTMAALTVDQLLAGVFLVDIIFIYHRSMEGPT